MSIALLLAYILVMASMLALITQDINIISDIFNWPHLSKPLLWFLILVCFRWFNLRSRQTFCNRPHSCRQCIADYLYVSDFNRAAF